MNGLLTDLEIWPTLLQFLQESQIFRNLA